MYNKSEIESLFNRELIKNSSEGQERIEYYAGINGALEALIKAADLLDRIENKKASEAITLILEDLSTKISSDVKK